MATMKDVAKSAGVGLGTVSRVINKNLSVKESTRLKVEQAIRDLNYMPNEVARNLKIQRTNTIALILPTIWHPFFSEFAYYVEDNLSKNGFKLIICNSDNKEEKEIEYLEMLKQNKVDGIVAITYSDIDRYVSSNLPIVSIDRHFSEDVMYITSDNYEGGKIALNKLIENGCREVAYIGSIPKYKSDIIERGYGFKDEANLRNIKCSMFEEQEPIENLELKIENFMKQNPNVDGIFTINDFMALIVIDIIKKLGKSVPEDIKIIGYDGVKMAMEHSTIVSTIRQPVEDMAYEAVNILIKMLNNQEFNQRVILPVKYTKGSTTLR